jgi:hypothetical protein
MSYDGVFPETYMVGDVEYESSLLEDLKINRADLSTEFSDHPKKYGWYSTAYEIALDEEQRAKAGLERAYAILDVQARNNMTAAGVKPTENKVKNVVITHKEYVEKQDDYFSKKSEAALIKAARDAMIHRKDCLVSLGANLRAEAASNPSILQDQYKHSK